MNYTIYTLKMSNNLKMQTQKSFKIYFCIEKNFKKENQNENLKNEIPSKMVTLEKEFNYDYHHSTPTIENLKDFFFTFIFQEYNYCKCVFGVYYKMNESFRLISSNEKDNLKEYRYDKLYLIKRNTQCNCEYKKYIDYMKKNKFEILKKLKESDELNINKDKRIAELENNVNKLSKQIHSLEKVDELKDIKNKKFEDFYDIVIDINTIKNVNKEGWKVKCSKKGLEKYKQFKDQDIITVGVIGNNNKGKSFLLSKISKIQLLSGTSINTEGLSVKYPELSGYTKRQLILLDSAGFETPVLKSDVKEEAKEENNKEKDELKEKPNPEEKKEDEDLKEKEVDKEIQKNKEFRDNAGDKNITELFLQSFIVKVCDILLVVVGKLTYSEQLLINKIKVESKKQNKGRIIIVHNLQEFRTVTQVVEYIKNSLLKCATFDLNKRKIVTTKQDGEEDENLGNKIEINKNDILNINEENVKEENEFKDVHFAEILNYGDNKKLEVFHLILANEDSDAGKIYNPNAYKFIENLYNIIAQPKKFDIFEQVKDNFKLLSNTILTENIENISFNDNEDIMKNKLIKLNFDKKLTLKRCLIDELGFSLFKTGNVELKYNYFKPDEKTLEIRVEVPGNVKLNVDHKVMGDNTIISITGKKIKDKSPAKLTDNIYNTREFGDYGLIIPLKIEDFKIASTKPKDGYPMYKNGICIIQYALAEKGEAASLEAEFDL